MKKWKNDSELFALMKEVLFSAVIDDIMEKEGYLHQFLPPKIQPINREMIVVGRAMPVLETDVFEEQTQGSSNVLMQKPFGLMLEALDDLKRDEVYI